MKLNTTQHIAATLLILLMKYGQSQYTNLPTNSNNNVPKPPKPPKIPNSPSSTETIEPSSMQQTIEPSNALILRPTIIPTSVESSCPPMPSPTSFPTILQASKMPSLSMLTTGNPTPIPTALESCPPMPSPTSLPSLTAYPSADPSNSIIKHKSPTLNPTMISSSQPSATPSYDPTNPPLIQPSTIPTSLLPTISQFPSAKPTNSNVFRKRPTISPTGNPSVALASSTALFLMNAYNISNHTLFINNTQNLQPKVFQLFQIVIGVDLLQSTPPCVQYISGIINVKSNYNSLNERRLWSTTENQMIELQVILNSTLLKSPINNSLAAQKYLHETVTAGSMQMLLRQHSIENNDESLAWIIVCNIDEPEKCNPNAVMNSQLLNSCKQSGMNWNRFYLWPKSMKGYVLWVFLLFMLWASVLAFAFISLFLFSSIRQQSNSDNSAKTWRFSTSAIVVFMALSRMMYFLLLFSNTISLQYENFACIEFSWDSNYYSNSNSDAYLGTENIHNKFWSPFYLFSYGIYYPILLLTCICRCGWFDLEINMDGYIILKPKGSLILKGNTIIFFFGMIIAIGMIVVEFIGLCYYSSTPSSGFVLMTMIVQIISGATILIYVSTKAYTLSTLRTAVNLNHTSAMERVSRLNDDDSSIFSVTSIMLAKLKLNNSKYKKGKSKQELSTSKNYDPLVGIKLSDNFSDNDNRQSNVHEDIEMQHQSNHQSSIHNSTRGIFESPMPTDNSHRLSQNASDISGLLSPDFSEFTSTTKRDKKKRTQMPFIKGTLLSDSNVQLAMFITSIFCILTAIPQVISNPTSAFVISSTLARIVELVLGFALLSGFRRRHNKWRRLMRITVSAENENLQSVKSNKTLIAGRSVQSSIHPIKARTF